MEPVFAAGIIVRLMAAQTWLAFAFGMIVGSFLNVCIFRIPQGTFWENARSTCPKCQARIPFWLNIPVISYLILRGRAKCCGTRISIQYPVVEALSGLLFVVCYWKYPFIFNMGGGLEVDPKDLIRCLHAWILVSVLIICSVIDIHLRIIPDVISLPMIATTPLVIYFHPDLTWQSGLLGVLLGGGSLFAVAWIYWVLRQQVGMGMGDVKLLAGIGGWLGYQVVLPSIFYGSILGSAVGLAGIMLFRKMDMSSKIPFGPFLAIGALVHLFLGARIQEFFLFPG